MNQAGRTRATNQSLKVKLLPHYNATGVIIRYAHNPVIEVVLEQLSYNE